MDNSLIQYYYTNLTPTIFKLFCLLLLLLLNACASNAQDNTPKLPAYLSLEETPKAEYEILFIGNSHVASYSLPKQVAALLHIGTEKTSNGFRSASSRFLDERSFTGKTAAEIKSRPWTHIVLQAQKYSSSGKYYYSTEAAQEWVRKVKNHSAIPIMFPEHPRKRNTEEGKRVHQLHISIAEKEAACVAPIGLAWDMAQKRYPGLKLHADGNHANRTGSFLTALVFYQVITGLPANKLPYIEGIRISEQTQTILKTVASETVINNPPCAYYSML